MKKFDKVIIIGVLIAAVVLIGYRQVKISITEKGSTNLIAKISVKGKLYKTVALTKEEKEFAIQTDLGKNVVRIHDNGIEVIDSSCRDHICEKTGFINKPGQVIVCLPNKVIIEIEGKAGENIDEISQ